SISSCAPFEVKFTNTSFFYNSFVWDLAGGISTMASPVQYYFNPGVYNTSLIVTSPGGCSDTAYKTLQVYDTIGTNLTYLPLNGCKPLTVDLNAFSPGPVTFTWDLGDGFIITTAGDSLRHVYNYFGDFVPKVILTDPSGCVIPFTGLDTIRIIGTTAKFGFDKKFFCDSGRVQFIDSTTYNDSLVSYNWDFGDGTSSSLQSPSHNYTAPGLYTVSLNLQTVNACVDTFSIMNAIKIVESPLITINGDSVICINEFITHFGVFQRPDTSVVQWRWQFPNSNNSNQQNPLSQQYRVAGSFVVNTIATNSSGCADTAIQNILIHPLPVVNMPGTITKQAGFPVTIPATYSPNTATWTWVPNATLDCSNCPTPTSTTKFNTQYTVSFVDSNGCRNTGQVQVIVVCKNGNVFVPNTFSPNGDGNNEIFMVRGRGLERVKTMRIFNRWGEVVFEQMNFPVNDASHGWDGKHKGKPALPDVYVYQIEVFCENSEIIRFEGNVALIQ
ncbi:MAG: PKD domain-containing protein, partial [Bacteroidota bacterium]